MELRTIAPADLAKILAEHKTWRASGGASGARADLAGADLADAYLAGANLAGADLADADLAGADLADAYLAGANLAGADLADAYLAGANLAGADLADANLAGADLAGAYLAGAYLADANLAGANLADANLAGAYLAGADLAGARNVPAGTEKVDPPTPYVGKGPSPERLAERAQAFRERNPKIPVIDNLDAKILEAVTVGAGKLEMGSWHSCETTHCRAGWAIHLAGKGGYALERKLGDPFLAGRAIYLASTGKVPHFFATNERAMEDIKKCAAEQTSPDAPVTT